MTSIDILRSYRAVAQKVGHHASAWVRLLLIASHGEEGCKARSLRISETNRAMKKTFDAWQRHGLIEIFPKPTLRRSEMWVRITPAGLDALGLEK